MFQDIVRKVQEIHSTTNEAEVGQIISVKDGIALVDGLHGVAYNELLDVEISDTEILQAVAFDLQVGSIGILLLGDYRNVSGGQKVRSTGKTLSFDVNYNFLGRVVDPLGRAQDGPRIDSNLVKSAKMELEKIAPGVITRQSVNRPLRTGVLVVDALVNIGRGQRELIIGDRQTGKTTLAIDTIINQKTEDVICVYVAIGQKQSKTKQLIETLKQNEALDYTVVVNSGASDAVALQYLAPYAGAAIAEYFMSMGRDVLIVYDDLTKHAWAYRQLSLLFRRPPGREAYPGDVFYLHSRLLERACQVNAENGGGSITALPIIETQANDISAYIPTNVISITDGQIFLESDLFNAGIRPAVNIGASVTRVGGAAQPKNLKKVAGSLKLELSQYRELAAFAKFGGDLDKATQNKLTRGAGLTQALVQPPNKPYKLAEEVIIVLAGNEGYFDTLAETDIQGWIQTLLAFAHESKPELIKELNTGNFSDELKTQIKTLVQDFKSSQKI